MNKISDCEVGEALPGDLLSKLPEGPLHHILSVLSIRETVRTSVLSRWWKDVWKHVPYLNLSYECFADFSSFNSAVNTILSLRSDGVNMITYLGEPNAAEMKLCGKIVQHALSHATEHIRIAPGRRLSFCNLFGVVRNNILKTMELVNVEFNIGFPCFEMVTTLKLERCAIYYGDKQEWIGLSEAFPKLLNLDITGCHISFDCDLRAVVKDLRTVVKLVTPTVVKLVTPSLLNLSLMDNLLGLEIIAPRLDFFSYVHTHAISYGLTFRLTHVVGAAQIFVDNMSDSSLMNFLHRVLLGVVNAKSVVLICKTHDMMKKTCKLLDNRASSFTKLDYLICMVRRPYTVAIYFQVGGSSKGPKVNHLQRDYYHMDDAALEDGELSLELKL